MTNFFKYKEYIGSIDANVQDLFLHGRILFIDDLVTYEAESLPELKTSFQEAVDDYLLTCQKLNRNPQQSFKGTLNVRIGPALHKEIALHAEMGGISINEYIKKAIQRQVEQDRHTDR